VWGVSEANDRKAAEKAIDLTEDFFRRMGLPVGTGDVAPITIVPEDVIGHLEQAGHTSLGEAKDIGPKEVRRILELAAD
jgi:NADP-dependent alcohol dehydrogenase